MANPQGTTFDDAIDAITLSTLRNYMKNPIDNMSKNNCLMSYLKKSKNIVKKSGGAGIRVNIEYAENSSFGYYDGYDSLNLNPSNPFTFADFDWKQASIAVIFSGKEKRANQGPEALYDLIVKRVKNAIKSFENNIEKSMFSDGTGFGGKEIEGLKLLIADDPSVGTIGGINRATSGNEFWRNYAIEADSSGELNANPDKNTIQQLMNKVVNRLTLGAKALTKVIIADGNMFNFYQQSLQVIQRITGTDKGEAGFRSLSFQGIPVINGGGIGGSCPSNHMYFLDTDGFHFNYLGQSMLDEISKNGDSRFQNQDAYGKIFAFMGNMSIETPRTQAVIWYTA